MSENSPLRPIIVCGVARSGTTFVSKLLNTHPDIAISDEYFIYKTPSLITWFDEVGSVFSSETRRGNWKKRKSQIMRMLWFYTSQRHLLQKGVDSRRFGNKTPGSEQYIEFYDNVFELNKPLYVYVLREGLKVFLSTRNTGWGKNANITGQVKRYINSINTIEKYQENNPERVCIIQLDQIQPAYGERLKEIKRVFDFIGEDMAKETVDFIRDWRSEHTTRQVKRNNPESIMEELPKADMDCLDQNQEYQEIMKKYGYKSRLHLETAN